jgi:hypothetical protein
MPQYFSKASRQMTNTRRQTPEEIPEVDWTKAQDGKPGKMKPIDNDERFRGPRLHPKSED